MKCVNSDVRHCLVILCFATICIARQVHNKRDNQNRGDLLQYCPPCDVRRCPLVSADNCHGIVMKDSCHCCPVCTRVNEGSLVEDTTAIPLDNETQPDACTGIECQRHQICLLNIQGLPVCRCPTVFYCKNKPRQKVCSSDGETFPSICHLKMAACDQSRKITVAKKESCTAAPQRELKEERTRQRQQRLQEREKERQDKLEAKRLEKEIKQELKRQQRLNERADSSSTVKNRRRGDRGHRRASRRGGVLNTGVELASEREQRRKNRKRQKRLQRQTDSQSDAVGTGKQNRQQHDNK